MTIQEQFQKYYDDVIKYKGKTASTVGKVKSKVEEAHYKYLRAQLQYYEYIRYLFKPLIGKCFMEHDYCIDGEIYPTVYYIITDTTSYSLERINRDYLNPREITTESATGFKIDDTNIVRIPATFICIKKVDDEHCGDCRGCIDCNDKNFHVGDFKCIFDSEHEDIFCASFVLKTGYITIPSLSGYVDDVIGSFSDGRQQIDVYMFDYVVKKFENYIWHKAQLDIYSLHESIERTVDRSIYNYATICGDFGCFKDLSGDRICNLRKRIKNRINEMTAAEKEEVLSTIKEYNYHTNLSKINDVDELESILQICEDVALYLEEDVSCQNDSYQYIDEEDDYDLGI